METAINIVVIASLLFAAAAAVRHIVRSILSDGFSRNGSALEDAYASRLMRHRSDFPLLPDEAVAARTDLTRHWVA